MLISEIVWGDDSAERDPNLMRYFISNTALDRLKRFQKTIIVGRKGSGKSALRRKLVADFTALNYAVVELTPSYNVIRNIVSDKDIANNYGEEIFFQYVWLRHLIQAALVEIGHKSRGSLAKDSHEYARRIAIDQGTNKDLLESFVDVLNRLKIKAGKLGEFGIQVENVLKEECEINILEYHLKQLISEYNLVIIIDDLDLGWDNSLIANNMLLGLMASANYLQALSNNIHVFICIREDVYQMLLKQTQHSDKMRDTENLRWDTNGLSNLLSERIRFNYLAKDIDPGIEPFLKVFPPTIGTSNIINWMIERTLKRPRELLQLCKQYTERNESSIPDADLLKQVELTYSNWKLDDLCTEYRYQYPGLEIIFNCAKTKLYKQKYHLLRREIEEILLSILIEAECEREWFTAIKDKTDIVSLLKILWEIGFLGDFIKGGAGGSKIIYSLSEPHDPQFIEVQIHPCFRKAMGTVERIRS